MQLIGIACVPPFPTCDAHRVYKANHIPTGNRVLFKNTKSYVTPSPPPPGTLFGDASAARAEHKRKYSRACRVCLSIFFLERGESLVVILLVSDDVRR